MALGGGETALQDACGQQGLVASDPAGELCDVPRFSACQTVEALAESHPCLNSSCPFLVGTQTLKCAYACTSAETCSAANPHLAFPNSATGRCERCSVPGCALCQSPWRCSRCFRGFELSGERCVFGRDEDFARSALATMAVLVLALVWFLFFLKWPHWRKRRKERTVTIPCRDEADDGRGEPRASHFLWEVLRLARLHHHWCKVRDWSAEGGGGAGAEPEPGLLGLCTNLHRGRIVGLGMPLYYNFMAFTTVLMLSFSLVHFGFSSAWLNAAALSRLNQMGGYASDDVHCDHLNSTSKRFKVESTAVEVISALGRGNLADYACLYCLGLALVVAFARWQKAFARRFWLRSRAMRWHAVALRGFDEDETDEAALKAAVERFLSQKLGRDPGNPLELAYVSICYDAHRLGERLPQLLDRLVTLEDVRLGVYSHEFADTAAEAEEVAELIQRATGRDVRRCGATREEWLAAARLKFERDVRELLRLPEGGEAADRFGSCGSAALRNCREVFAVFKTVEDCVEVMRHCEGRCREESFITWLDAQGRALQQRLQSTFTPSGKEPLLQERHWEVVSMMHEPVGVCWHHYGLSDWERIRGFACALLSVLLCMLAIQVFVVYPSINYSLQYRAVVDSSPGGVGSTIFGVLIGTSNWLVCVCIACRVTRAGFLRTDREEVVIYVCFTFMCVFNTLKNVGVAIQTVFANERIWIEESSLNNIRAIDWEARVSQEIFSMFFPGSFVGCLLWPLQGFLWPFLEGFLNLRFKRADSLNVRIAERRLEALPVGLAWDYQGSITCPVLGFLLLFLASNMVQEMLLCLAVWSAFFYCLQHFNHLRMAKMAYCTSNRLDMAVLCSWGVVLGEVAAGAATWGVRARHWHWAAIPASFLAGLTLVPLCIARWARPLEWSWSEFADEMNSEMRAVTLEETRSITLFDWANCNPVLVLKSQVMDLSAAGIPPQLPFSIGKAHAWEAIRRSRVRDPTGKAPQPQRVWYEPGSLFYNMGLID